MVLLLHFFLLLLDCCYLIILYHHYIITVLRVIQYWGETLNPKPVWLKACAGPGFFSEGRDPG